MNTNRQTAAKTKSSNVWNFSKINFQRLELFKNKLPTSGTFAKKTSNAWNFFPALFGLLFVAVSASAASFVYENDVELLGRADLNGDGRPDAVIVNRESGLFSVAYGTGTDDFDWVAPRASGVEDVASFAAGRLLSTAQDDLVFAASDANRLVLVSAPASTSFIMPESLFTHPLLGPNAALALPLPGPGSQAGLDDLIAIGSRNNLPDNALRIHYRNESGGDFTSLHEEPGAGTRELLRRVSMMRGQTNHVAMMVRGGVTETFQVLDMTNTTGIMRNTLSTLRAGTRYVQGFFDPHTNTCQFLFYVPGENNVDVTHVERVAPDQYEFFGGMPLDFGEPLRQVFVLEADGSNYLAIVFGEGETARLYQYDTAQAPSILHTWQADPEAPVTGFIPVAPGRFLQLNGDAGGRTTNATAHTLSGGVCTPGTTRELPAAPQGAGKANVLLFIEEPFVSSNPRKVAAYRADDWTDAILDLPGALRVVSETDHGPALGLGPRVTKTLSAPTHGAHYGLPNQPHNGISVHSLLPPVGMEIAEIGIIPLPGTYRTSIQISFTSSAPAAIYYRQNTNAWTLYSAPFRVFADTEIHYYAVDVSGRATRLQAAAYAFTEPPDTLDSDNDGVPDYVEIALGLDPLAGEDTDGDGLSDLEEILLNTNPALADSDGDTFSDLTELRGGSDPNDPLSIPALPITGDIVRPQNRSAHDLVLTPRAYDGASSNIVLSQTGTLVRAHAIGGALLASAPARNLSISGQAISNPAVRLAQLPAGEQPPLLIAATETHFSIDTPDANKRRGRELLGLYPAPDIAPVVVPYAYGGGNLADEAAAWSAAAQTAYAAAPVTISVSEIGLYDTTAALLLERWIALTLEQRDHDNGLAQSRHAVTNFTLFPFRDSDAGRDTPTSADLYDLRNPTTNFPGHDLRLRLNEISSALKTGQDAGTEALRAVTREAYRLASLATDSSQDDVYFPPPDAIRHVLLNGAFMYAYASNSALSTSVMAQARSAADQIITNATPRPKATFTLETRAESFQNGCSTLWTADTGLPKNLYDARGNPLLFPNAFRLTPGARIQVEAYTDLPPAGCHGGDALEVLSLSLLSLSSLTGQLTCEILPPAAASAGAGWRIAELASDQWNASGATETLGPAAYTVEFADIPGWRAPASRSRLVTTGAVNAIIATYAYTNQPPAPTGLRASRNRTNMVLVAWNATADTDAYLVWRALSSSGEQTLLSDTLVTPRYEDLAVTTNQSYYYWVASTNAAGMSLKTGPVRGLLGEDVSSLSWLLLLLD